jgi:hypothetical protein
VTFRTKLLLLSSITVAGAVALVTGAVSIGPVKDLSALTVSGAAIYSPSCDANWMSEEWK